MEDEARRYADEQYDFELQRDRERQLRDDAARNAALQDDLDALRLALGENAKPAQPTLGEAARMLVEMGILFELKDRGPHKPHQMWVYWPFDTELECDKFGFSLGRDDYSSNPYPTLAAIRARLEEMKEKS